MNTESAQPKESVLHKIRSLFKMADPANGASQNEMEIAMQKAKELMVRHGLEQMQVGEVSEKAGPSVLHERFNTGRKKRDEDRWIPAVLKQVFEVDILFSKVWDAAAGVAGGYRHIYVFVGMPEDVEMAKLILPIIYGAMSRGLNAHLKARGITWNTTVANSFFRGVADGFIKASVHGHHAAMKAFKKEEQDRFAIVLANKKDAITRYQKEKMTVTPGRKSQSSARHDAAAFQDGFNKGASIDATTKLNAA
ncbi:MAG: DUF2786 domain-containing protein [Terrimicrobiaceae bacterium]|nr:DUF2786 domain-containing protein [Terrimicrobiaceae bacterium]